MATRVSETMIFVRDMDEAIRFYTQQVGFKLVKRFDWGFAYLDMDGKSTLGLMLESKWQREYPDTDELPAPRVALQTDDFDHEIARLKNNGVHMGVVKGEPGGHRAVNFWDVDENAFFLWTDPTEPMD